MFSKTFAKAVAFATLVVIGAHAAPAVGVSELIAARDATTVDGVNSASVDGHLFICVNANFAQPCANLDFNVGVCNNLEAPFQDSISSAGPDAGFTCIVYKDKNCSGQAVSIQSPGIINMKDVGINDAITSFQCFRS